MREPAYEGFTPEEIREGIITSRLPVESEWPSAFSDLIERCWHHNANDRPDFDEIVRHIVKSYHTSDADAPPSYSFSAAFPPLTRTRGSSRKGMSFTKPLSRRSARTSDSKMKLRLSVAARPPVHTVSV
ncbi:hypothetical protein M427DRAFT_295372 [Gonapodya prolifera JEL478]|uniref:Serine-threonine/tyrosine-protein kinase catalytic domain-containing protein n=1 Tax=Gonapodya prolifera (strain JEL478) TaxID=1344416 RepID=A0A139AHL9_GONPJ|nr:hypothetical protein M427DRAFT_295372 [Gonapodya prolifera JEL478]|eukprot:KXS16260.1 hypothetical protein M427DRAFT_295372 [Gonapodya prolifera JEL478]